MINFIIESISTFFGTLFHSGSEAVSDPIILKPNDLLSEIKEIHYKINTELHDEITKIHRNQVIELNNQVEKIAKSEIQTIISKYEEGIKIFGQELNNIGNLRIYLDNIDLILSEELNPVIDRRSNLVNEIKKITLEYNREKNLLEIYPKDIEIQHAINSYEFLLNQYNQALSYFDLQIVEVQNKIRFAKLKLHDLRKIMELESGFNTTLNQQLKEFQLKFKDVLNSINQIDSLNPQTLKEISPHFREQLTVLNRNLGNRNCHLFEMRNIINSHYDELLRARRRNFYNKKFFYKQQETKEFHENYFNAIKKLNLKHSTGLKEVFELNSKRRNKFFDSFFASNIKFFKNYFGTLYSVYEDKPYGIQFHKFDEKFNEKDSLCHLFNSLFFDIKTMSDKSNRLDTMYVFFVFRRGGIGLHASKTKSCYIT